MGNFSDFSNKNKASFKAALICYSFHSRVVYGFPVDTPGPYYQDYMRANIKYFIIYNISYIANNIKYCSNIFRNGNIIIIDMLYKIE